MERLAAGCLFLSFPGRRAPGWIRRLAACGFGGVVLSASNAGGREQLRALVAELRAERPELLVALAEEGGDVTALEAGEGSSYPAAAALGAVDDVELTELVAGAIAWDLVDVGANLNLAPVADLLRDPWNPSPGVRSYGSDPELVARHAAAFVRGTRRAGVVACPGRVPGLGGDGGPLFEPRPTDAVLEEALLPFRACVEAGAYALMAARAYLGLLGGAHPDTGDVPLRGLLRDDLRFTGMVLTEALDAPAVAAGVGLEEAAVRALQAGADGLWLGPGAEEEDVRRVLAAIVQAVRAGRLSLERLEEAVERVRLTADWASHPPRGDRVEREVGLEAARRALRFTGTPVLSRLPYVVVLEAREAGALPQAVDDWLREELPGTRVERVVEGGAPAWPVPRGRQLVLVLRDAHRSAWQRAEADDLLAANPDAIVVELGLPEWSPSAPVACVAAFGGGRASVRAVGELLARSRRARLYWRPTTRGGAAR
ncbi:MAG TPA: glycoside hydrolase family 3 N-terminal domain-containing protein [Gaiellaceae bacterium]|nr:glycoside hydrolase family 3 N-terminal domain-containing protein [Gaiellaceae bacterium]